MIDKATFSNEQFECFKISSDLFVVLAKTTEAFREIFANTLALQGHSTEFELNYPKLSRDGLASDQMGMFIVGVSGKTVNPKNIDYDEGKGILTLEELQVDDLNLYSTVFLLVPKRDKIIFNILGQIGMLTEETIFGDKQGVHYVETNGGRENIIRKVPLRKNAL
jgi:hypothetical protein